jgi:hypothetical protein
MNTSGAAKTLGINYPNFGSAQVKEAYRKMAMDHHPDRGGDHDKFLEIKAAYDYLWPKVNRLNATNILALTIEEAFFGCDTSITINGENVKVHIKPGQHHGNDIIAIDEHFIKVVIVSDYVLDAVLPFTGNVTRVLNVSPFLMITGGFVDVDMMDRRSVKVRIPAGLEANSLIMVARRGFYKDETCSFRGDCLLRIIPDIRKLAEYDQDELLQFSKQILHITSE